MNCTKTLTHKQIVLSEHQFIMTRVACAEGVFTTMHPPTDTSITPLHYAK